MAFLRKGFLRSANRRNELHCRIDAAPFAAIVLALLWLFLGDIAVPHGHRTEAVDLVVARHSRSMPGALRQGAITIAVSRDGTIYFGNLRARLDDLPDEIHSAVLNGAEKRIYLRADARAKYYDVKMVLGQIHLPGIEKVTILAESPYPAASPSSRPTG